LEPVHPGALVLLDEPSPVSGDVAGVADGDAQRVELAVERL
jgi:hypothetical protein